MSVFTVAELVLLRMGQAACTHATRKAETQGKTPALSSP